jgi:hypothetical protein
MGPAPSEQIQDPRFEESVYHICLRPTMHVGVASYDCVCAFIDGFNAARSGGPLIGLREWLVVRTNSGNNQRWPWVARMHLKADAADLELPEGERSIRALGRLLAEFFEFRRRNGLTKIFYDYGRWLLRRSWYTGPLRKTADKDKKAPASGGVKRNRKSRGPKR